MDKVVEKLIEIKNDCAYLANEISKNFNIAEDHPPVGGLNICHNICVQNIELISFYRDQWERPRTKLKSDIIRMRGENAQRIMMQTSTMFVFSVSSLEFNAKRAAKRYPYVLDMDFSKRRYLRDVLKKSVDKGLMDNDTFEQWCGLLEIRNCTVHNNAIAEINKTVRLSNGLSIELNTDTMIKGNLETFPAATQWMVNAYAHWCGSFLEGCDGVAI